MSFGAKGVKMSVPSGVELQDMCEPMTGECTYCSAVSGYHVDVGEWHMELCGECLVSYIIERPRSDGRRGEDEGRA